MGYKPPKYAEAAATRDEWLRFRRAVSNICPDTLALAWEVPYDLYRLRPVGEETDARDKWCLFTRPLSPSWREPELLAHGDTIEACAAVFVATSVLRNKKKGGALGAVDPSFFVFVGPSS